MSTTAKLILSTLVGLFLIGGLSAPAAAKYIGAEPRSVCCCECGDAGPDCAQGQCADSGEGGSSGCGCSLTGKGLCHSEPVLSATGANGAGLELELSYQTSLADGEVGTVDTGLGYGWGHSYNELLFQQSRDLFRLQPGGTVTKFQRAGRRGGLSATRGHREIITENPGGLADTIDIEDFVGGVVRRYQKVTGNPIRVGGREPWMLKTITDRNGNQTTLTYAGGLLETVTGSYGREIGFDYAGDRLQTITAPLGRTTSLSYDGAGNLASIEDAEGDLTRFSYTSRHQISERIDPNGNRWRYRYDSAGNLVEVKDQTGAQVYGMSNDRDWATDLRQLLRTKQRVYNVDALTEVAITTVKDGNLQDWQYHYNSDGYVTEVVAPDGATTSYAYDPAAYDLESMTDANGNTTSYDYDAKQRRIKETDAKGFMTSYSYADTDRPPAEYTGPDCPDEIHEIFFPNGAETEYQYDAGCNRIKETRDVGGLDLVTEWTYNPDGTVAAETEPNGHTTIHEYDAHGNLVKTTDAEGYMTRYVYDDRANRICMVDG